MCPPCQTEIEQSGFPPRFEGLLCYISKLHSSREIFMNLCLGVAWKIDVLLFIPPNESLLVDLYLHFSLVSCNFMLIFEWQDTCKKEYRVLETVRNQHFSVARYYFHIEISIQQTP